MGNKLSILTSSGSQSKKYTIPWNVEVVSTKPFNMSRFLKSYFAKDQHFQRDLLLKVFTKTERIDLSPYKFLLSYYRETINRCCPHVLPYMAEQESDTHGFLIRPFLFHSLPDFLLQNQWLTRGHKVLYSIQMILAVAELHAAGLVHGDIKLSNFLVTRTFDIMLADYAPYKPYQVSTTNPAALRYFFTDTIAPERIVQSESDMDTIMMSTPEADVFSLGSALLELWTSIKPFDSPTLYEYSEAKSGDAITYILSLLNCVEHVSLRELIHTMIHPAPSQRVNLSSLNMATIFSPEELLASDIILTFRKFFNPSNLDDVVHVGAALFDGICDMYLNNLRERKLLTKCYFCDIRQRLQLEQQRDDLQYNDKKTASTTVLTRVSSTINVANKNKMGPMMADNIGRRSNQQNIKKPLEMPHLCTTNMEIPFKVIEHLDSTVLRSLMTCDCIQRILKDGRVSEISWNCNVFGPFRRILASDTLQAAMYHVAYSLMQLIQLGAFSIQESYKKGMLLVCSYALFMDDSYVSHLIRMAYRVFRLQPSQTTLSGIVYLFNLLTLSPQEIYYIPLLVLGETFLPTSQHERFLKGMETARHQLLNTSSTDEGFLKSISNIFLYTASSSTAVYPYLINHFYVLQLFPLLLASIARLSGGDKAMQEIVCTILLQNKTSLLYNVMRATTITPAILSSVRHISENITLISNLLPGILPLCLEFAERMNMKNLCNSFQGNTVASIFYNYLSNMTIGQGPKNLLERFKTVRSTTSGNDIFALVRSFFDGYHHLPDFKIAGNVLIAIMRFFDVLPLPLQKQCLYLFCRSIFIPNVMLSNSENGFLWTPGSRNTWLLLEAVSSVAMAKSPQDALLFTLLLSESLSRYIHIRLAGALMLIVGLSVDAFNITMHGCSPFSKHLFKRPLKQSVLDKQHHFMRAISPKLSPIIPSVLEYLYLFYSGLDKHFDFSGDTSVCHDLEYNTQSELLHEVMNSYAPINRLTLLTPDEIRSPERMFFLLQAAIQGTFNFLSSISAFIKSTAETMNVATSNMQELHENHLPLHLLVPGMNSVEAIEQNQSMSFGKTKGRSADLLQPTRDVTRITFVPLTKADSHSTIGFKDTSYWSETSTSRLAVDEHAIYRSHNSEKQRGFTICNDHKILLKENERARYVLELFYGPVDTTRDRMEAFMLGTEIHAAHKEYPLQSIYSEFTAESANVSEDTVLHSTLLSGLLMFLKPFSIFQSTALKEPKTPRSGIFSGYVCKTLNLQSAVITRSWFPYLQKSSIPPSALPATLNIMLNNLLLISPGTHSLPTVTSFIKSLCKGDSDDGSKVSSSTQLEFTTLPDLQAELSSTPINITYTSPLIYYKEELVKYILSNVEVSLEFISMRETSKGDLIFNSKNIQGMQSKNTLYTNYSNLLRNASDLVINASLTHYLNKTSYRCLLPINPAGLNDLPGTLERMGTITGKLTCDFSLSIDGAVATKKVYNNAHLKSFAYSSIGNIFIILDSNNYIHFYLNPIDEAIKFLAQKILLLSTMVDISVTSSSDVYADHCAYLAGRSQNLDASASKNFTKSPTTFKLQASPALESLEGIMEYLSTGVLVLPLAVLHIPEVQIIDVFVEQHGIPIIGGGKATEKKSIRHEFFVMNLVSNQCMMKLLVDTDILIQQYAEALLVPKHSWQMHNNTSFIFSVNDATFSLSVNHPNKNIEPVDFGLLHKSQITGSLNENAIQYLMPYVSTSCACTLIKAFNGHMVEKRQSGGTSISTKPANIHVQTTLSTALEQANSLNAIMTRIAYQNHMPTKRGSKPTYSVIQRRVLTYYDCYPLFNIVAVLSSTIVTRTSIFDSTSGNHMYTLPDNCGHIKYAFQSGFGNIGLLTSLYKLIILESRIGNLLSVWTLMEKQKYSVHMYPEILEKQLCEAVDPELKLPVNYTRYYSMTTSLFVTAYGMRALFFKLDNTSVDPVLHFVGSLDVRMTDRPKAHADDRHTLVFSAIASHKASVVLGLSNGAVLAISEHDKELLSCKMLSSPQKYKVTSNVDLTSTDKNSFNDYKRLHVLFKAQSLEINAHQRPVVAIKTCAHSVFSADSAGMILFYH